MQLQRTKAASPNGSLLDMLASIGEPELRKSVVDLAKPRHLFHQRAENRRAAQLVAGALEESGVVVSITAAAPL